MPITAQRRRRQAHERAEQRRNEVRGPSLELSAWKALREELIESEQHVSSSEEAGQQRRERRISAPLWTSETATTMRGSLAPSSLLDMDEVA